MNHPRGTPSPKRPKRRLAASLALVGLAGLEFGAAAARAAVSEVHVFETFGGQPSVAIPDGDLLGISDHRVVESALDRVGRVEVSLTVSGEFTGDLYVYLQHDTGFSVLLNRPGRGSSLPSGYGDAGLSVTLADDAAGGNIHGYRSAISLTDGSPLTGRWSPDGRGLLPTSTPSLFDAAEPTALLSSFGGLDPGGIWTLFASDLSGGGTHRLESWSLEFEAVPEPGASAVAVALLLVGFGSLRARRRAPTPRPD